MENKLKTVVGHSIDAVNERIQELTFLKKKLRIVEDKNIVDYYNAEIKFLKQLSKQLSAALNDAI